MPDAGGSGGGGKLRRRLPIDAVVDFRIDARAGMRNGGQMDDLIHIREQRAEIARPGKIRALHDFDVGGEGRLRRRADRGTDRPPVFRKRRHHRATDESDAPVTSVRVIIHLRSREDQCNGANAPGTVMPPAPVIKSSGAYAGAAQLSVSTA